MYKDDICQTSDLQSIVVNGKLLVQGKRDQWFFEEIRKFLGVFLGVSNQQEKS